MKLPFVSHRRAAAAVAVATAAFRCILDETDKELHAAQAAQYRAEAALSIERGRYRRTVAYIDQVEEGRHERTVRLARSLRAVARLRAEAAVQRRVIRILNNQLLDATGNQGEPLLDAARTALDLDKEDGS